MIVSRFELTHPVPWDPLQRIFEEQVQLGYWQAHYDAWTYVIGSMCPQQGRGLAAETKQFALANILEP